MAQSSNDLEIKIVYPKEGSALPPVSSSFVLGSVTPGSQLVISSATAMSVHPAGGFIAMLPMAPGPFEIVCEAASGQKKVTAVRKITVSQPLATTPEKPLRFDKGQHWPDIPIEFVTNDVIRVKCKGSPGAKARFRIKGVTEFLPMVEKSLAPKIGGPVAGLYEGVYQVQPQDEIKNGKIIFRLERGARHQEMTAKGTITLNQSRVPRVAEVTQDLISARSGPDRGIEQAGYEYFWQKGTRLALAGRVGNTLRVKLGNKDWAWVGEDQVTILPQGTPPPHSNVGSVRVTRSDRSTMISIGLQERLPYRIEQSPDEAWFTVTLYGAVSNTDWMHYDSQDPIVQSLAWQQPAPEVYSLAVRVKGKAVWGYDARYEGTNFVLELRDPPLLKQLGKKSKKPLAGLTVCVDAGHGGEDDGATGPLGTKEKTVALALSKKLHDRLEALGAEVIFTRQTDIKLVLLDRPKIAWQGKADFLVSMHANALPDGENPFERNGYGLYYFQPRGLELAKQIHKNYKKYVPLRDDGLHYGNLALCRPTQMPSVLVESAYMIDPFEESLLNDPNFQDRCALAVTSGIISYLKSIQ